MSNKENGLEIGKLKMPNQQIAPKEADAMKCSKTAILRNTRRIPESRFEDQKEKRDR